MQYAVIETGGKQYVVKKGDILEVESLGLKKDADVLLDKVLLYVSDEDVNLGDPYLSDISIKARVLEAVRGDKIVVGKFKAKSKYRRMTGHKQYLTKIQIEDLLGTQKKTTKSREK